MAKVWEYESNKTDNLSILVAKNEDIVMTNPEMARYLLSTIHFNTADTVLDPCKGKGAFYDNIPSDITKDWCEINEGRDFFTYTNKVKKIISNPPFVPRKLFWDFHLHAMDVAEEEIYWLINMSSLNVFTPKRLQIMKDKGWFIQNFMIVSDKRWFGRYVFVKFSRTPNDVFSWNQRSF